MVPGEAGGLAWPRRRLNRRRPPLAAAACGELCCRCRRSAVAPHDSGVNFSNSLAPPAAAAGAQSVSCALHELSGNGGSKGMQLISLAAQPPLVASVLAATMAERKTDTALGDEEKACDASEEEQVAELAAPRRRPRRVNSNQRGSAARINSDGGNGLQSGKAAPPLPGLRLASGRLSSRETLLAPGPSVTKQLEPQACSAPASTGSSGGGGFELRRGWLEFRHRIRLASSAAFTRTRLDATQQQQRQFRQASLVSCGDNLTATLSAKLANLFKERRPEQPARPAAAAVVSIDAATTAMATASGSTLAKQLRPEPAKVDRRASSITAAGDKFLSDSADADTAGRGLSRRIGQPGEQMIDGGGELLSGKQGSLASVARPPPDNKRQDKDGSWRGLQMSTGAAKLCAHSLEVAVGGRTGGAAAVRPLTAASAWQLPLHCPAGRSTDRAADSSSGSGCSSEPDQDPESDDQDQQQARSPAREDQSASADQDQQDSVRYLLGRAQQREPCMEAGAGQGRRSLPGLQQPAQHFQGACRCQMCAASHWPARLKIIGPITTRRQCRKTEGLKVIRSSCCAAAPQRRAAARAQLTPGSNSAARSMSLTSESGLRAVAGQSAELAGASSANALGGRKSDTVEPPPLLMVNTPSAGSPAASQSRLGGTAAPDDESADQFDPAGGAEGPAATRCKANSISSCMNAGGQQAIRLVQFTVQSRCLLCELRLTPPGRSSSISQLAPQDQQQQQQESQEPQSQQLQQQQQPQKPSSQQKQSAPQAGPASAAEKKDYLKPGEWLSALATSSSAKPKRRHSWICR